MMNKIENAVQYAINIAKDNKHGYDQKHRWGKPDFDCSGLVITALEESGIPAKQNGATYTGNMRKALLKCGFKEVKSKVNISTGKGMKRGDILLRVGHHVAFYIGDNKIVHASINEKGTTTGGKSGDQTGKEICTRSYYNGKWNSVLRYVETNAEVKTDSTTFKVKVEVDNLRIRNGAGLDSKIKGYVKEGTHTITEVEKSDGYTWGKLSDGSGWIALDHTTIL
ncbi:hypothetical protein P261_02285 [Lachnospiraceae bacterium TWA4]|nr:hypothetical protein P261_02285 [Lachnospiraceae bacterium TWA4]